MECFSQELRFYKKAKQAQAEMDRIPLGLQPLGIPTSTAHDDEENVGWSDEDKDTASFDWSGTLLNAS